MPPARWIAGAASAAVVASTVGAAAVALAGPAVADPAPGQAVDNDWGQTAAQVEAEIRAQVAADPRVVAAWHRYQQALVAYRGLMSQIAAAKKAHDAARLAQLRKHVYARASEVVAAHLAKEKTEAAVTAQVRAHHYIKAPYVALPAKPTGLTVTGQAGRLTLAWAAVPGASAYRIFRDGVQVATTIVASYLDTGLEDGVAYAYRVRAINVAGWSPLSDEVTGVPTPAPPDVPTAVTATPGDTQVMLQWGAVTAATGYEVFRDGELVGTPAEAGFLDTGLVDGTSYSYTVVAVNGAQASAPSAAVAAVPVAAAPAAPGGLVATAGDGTVTLTWASVTGATSYQVIRDGVAISTPQLPTYTDTGLTNGTSHDYAVLAYRLNSPASSPSVTVSATPVAPPLAAPVGISATPGDQQVRLTWTAVAGATSYRVYRGSRLAGSPATTSFTDRNLNNGTSYSYTVVAVSAVSVSLASAPVSATPTAATSGAPTGLSGQAGDATATLSWSAVTGATSYNVYRDGVLLANVATTGFVDSGLTNGTAYSYRVTAVRSGVESAPSATVGVTPLSSAPAVPTGLTAVPGDGLVTLTWTASAGATSYNVYRDGVLVGSPVATSFTDGGLSNGTAYTWTVAAVKATATSALSAPVSATPAAAAPPAPTGLAAVAGDTQVALSWNPVAVASSYGVYRNGALVATPASAGYVDTGLTDGITYSYYVVALAGGTASGPSATVTAMPVKPPVNGTYTGAVASIADGHGTLRVTITLTNGKITSAAGALLTHDSSDTLSINNSAIPQYNTKAVAANSANISKVSGATLTWAAYKTSLQSALTQAGL